MAQKKAQKKYGKEKKSVSGIKKKVMPVKKAAAKKTEKVGRKAAIVKKVIVKTKEAKKIKEVREIKKPTIVLHEFRINIRCRRCFFVDGYTVGEKTCHNCKEEIYEIDKI